MRKLVLLVRRPSKETPRAAPAAPRPAARRVMLIVRRAGPPCVLADPEAPAEAHRAAARQPTADKPAPAHLSGEAARGTLAAGAAGALG
jgi:hypothetical protein